jgi:capsule biosynthesis phosphatase
MRQFIINLVNALCVSGIGSHGEVQPKLNMIEQVRRYKKIGFDFVGFTSRQMRAHKCSVGEIDAYIPPIIIDWLQKDKVPCDEIHVGKLWCGNDRLYIEDRAIRPEGYFRLGYEDIFDLVKAAR